MPGDGRTPLSTPSWLLFIRIAQIVLAIVVLGLAAYGVYYWGGYAFGGLNIFTAIVTFIACGYIIAATTAAKKIYNYWAILGLDIFLTIFWLSSMATAAAFTASINDTFYDDGFYTYYTDYSPAAKGAVGGAAGVSGILFVLFAVCLILEAIAISRAPATSATTTTTGGAQPYGAAPYAGAPGTGPGHEKYEMTNPNQGPLPSQPINGQQPYPTQSPPPQGSEYSYPPPQQQGYPPTQQQQQYVTPPPQTQGMGTAPPMQQQQPYTEMPGQPQQQGPYSGV